MTYEECLAGIHSRKTFSGGGPTLDRIRRLMELLGNPQDGYKTVHIAGTNGKGSTSAMIAAALRESGFKTGLFTSPFLVDFRERIQMDGEMISREMLISCYSAVMKAETLLENQGFEPVNEFELVTAIGFLAFARAQVDYAVLEVGLGGRTDPTNLISCPEVCVITPIDLDHTAILGDTIPQIAGEKAGIIKSGRPVVVTRQTEAALEVIRAKADALGAEVTVTKVPAVKHYDPFGSVFSYDGTELTIPLLGAYQMDNAAAAFEAAGILGLDPEKTMAAFAKVSWPGRLQYVLWKPDILIDCGHNPQGLRSLAASIEALFPGRSIITVMAMMKDKDYLTCIPIAARLSRKVIASTVGLPRSLPPQELASVAGEYCETQTAETVFAGIHAARAQAEPDDLIVVCGSVYAAGEAVGLLQREQ